MCEAAMVYIAIASTAASIYAQADATQAGNRHRRRLSAANATMIREQALLSQGQLRAQESQEHQATSLQLRELKRRAEIARGTAIAAAGQVGTVGGSVAALDAEFARQEVESVRNLYRNQEFRDEQHEATATRIQQGESIANLNNLYTPDALPSFLGAALRIGGAGAGAYFNMSDAGKASFQAPYKSVGNAAVAFTKLGAKAKTTE